MHDQKRPEVAFQIVLALVPVILVELRPAVEYLAVFRVARDHSLLWGHPKVDRTLEGHRFCTTEGAPPHASIGPPILKKRPQPSLQWGSKLRLATRVATRQGQTELVTGFFQVFSPY